MVKITKYYKARGFCEVVQAVNWQQSPEWQFVVKRFKDTRTSFLLFVYTKIKSKISQHVIVILRSDIFRPLFKYIIFRISFIFFILHLNLYLLQFHLHLSPSK